MPPALRSRIALFSLLGVFLIPIVVTNLRGLTHILTCEQDAETPFTLIVDERGGVSILSSTVISREPGEDVGSSQELCGGLTLNLAAGQQRNDKGKVFLNVPITNNTEHTWEGSVGLRLRGTTIPVDIGRIKPGETVTDTVELHLEPGTHELSGSLLIGP